MLPKSDCKGIFFITLVCFYLIPNISIASVLWPVEVGEMSIYTRTDNAGRSWTVTLQVLESVRLGGNDYYHLHMANYRLGETEDFYMRSTSDSVYSWTGTEEIEVFKIGPVGTRWDSGGTSIEISSIESVTVPFGGPYTAYVHKKIEPGVEGSDYWYTYIVPDIGMVKEVDYWTDDAPKIEELVWKGIAYTKEQLDQAVLDERKRYDPSADGVIGLEEAIHALEIVSGQK